MRRVTLTTDFGTRDGYAAALKGRFASLDAEIDVQDLSHDLPAYDRIATAFALRRSLPSWPPDSCHLVVVDPGVGSDRAILAALFPFGWVVAPDNGVLHFLLQRWPSNEIRQLQDDESWTAPSTFEGRDRMAQAVVDLVRGRMEQWQPAESWLRLNVPTPHIDVYRAVGAVLHIDRYGTCITNLERYHFPSDLARDQLKVFLKHRFVGPLSGCYNDVHRGEPLALWNSDGFLEIACRETSASAMFDAQRGETVELVSSVPLRDTTAAEDAEQADPAPENETEPEREET